MDLSLSDEQRLLGEAASRFIAGRYSFEQRRAILQSSDGFSRDIWRELADLGWLGLPFAEDFGGLGAGPVEIGIVMQAIGRALIVEPYLSTIVLSGGLIGALAPRNRKTRCCQKSPKARSWSRWRTPSRRRASRWKMFPPWRRKPATAGIFRAARKS